MPTDLSMSTACKLRYRSSRRVPFVCVFVCIWVVVSVVSRAFPPLLLLLGLEPAPRWASGCLCVLLFVSGDFISYPWTTIYSPEEK